jgi:FeS assembly SUF system regulator
MVRILEETAMIRMSKLTDYAILVLAHLAETRDPLHSASEVAEHTGVTPATASKLLKLLGRAGLVESVRGAQGGYALARAPADITAAEVINALEGPLAITECSSAESHCELEPGCRMSEAWRRINLGIHRVLDEITLEQLVAPAEAPLRRMEVGAGPRPDGDAPAAVAASSARGDGR